MIGQLSCFLICLRVLTDGLPLCYTRLSMACQLGEIMKSYVRDYVESINTIYEQKRRVDVVRNGVTCRFTTEDFEIMQRVVDHFGVSRTTVCEMLLEQAVYDAAEQLGLWSPAEAVDQVEEVEEEE